MKGFETGTSEFSCCTSKSEESRPAMKGFETPLGYPTQVFFRVRGIPPRYEGV